MFIIKTDLLVILFIISSLLFLTSCDEESTGLIIKNKTTKEVYCMTSTIHPDTTIDFISESILKSKDTYLYEIGQTKALGTLAFCDQSIWSNYVKNDTLLLFVFLKGELDTVPWSRVISEYRIYRKYEIKFDQLTGNDCEFTIE